MSAIAPGQLLPVLVREKFLIPTPVRGVYALGAEFCRIADAVTLRLRNELGGEAIRFSSVMPRIELERVGYFRNFPHLLGTVHCFCGDEADHRRLLALHNDGQDWSAGQAMSDLVMIPAACYPVYAILAARGVVPAEGYHMQVEANCFRHEPSDDPVRLQSFHMLEGVRIGGSKDVIAFRDSWLEKGRALMADWGLAGQIEAADDPFFGRAAIVMAKSQRERELKFELKIVVSDAARPTACMSANYHLDRMGQAAGLRDGDGTTIHSACVGFGIERVTLALLRQHGTALATWPASVRAALGLTHVGSG